MSYSEKEMKEICLGLAEQAEPLEAEALRAVAKNYEAKDDGGPSLTIRQILTISAILYALCLPVMLFIGSLYVQPKPPTGTTVEQLVGFQTGDDGWYFTRTYRFVRRAVSTGRNEKVILQDLEPMTLVAYEDERLLGDDEFWIQTLTPKDDWRFVKVKPKDGTDPRRNGRRYYLVRR
jgi:hypothetical protein